MKLKEIDARLRGKDTGGRWYINGQGQTFVLVEGPVEFRMGSQPEELGRDPDETPYRALIPRTFAMASKEVSVEQYQEFLEQNPTIHRLTIGRCSPDPTGPRNDLSWYDAAAFCNWLSRAEGLPECYQANPTGEFAEGMQIRADALKRGGYRLPTEAEWEYACRAGAGASRYYGLSTELLRKYAWYQDNSQDRAWPCGSLLPNDLGIFDMLGNVYEWCQDAYERHQAERTEIRVDDINILINIDHVAPRVSRGLAFNCFPSGVRSASRNSDPPFVRSLGCGFRLARTHHGSGR